MFPKFKLEKMFKLENLGKFQQTKSTWAKQQ